MLERGRLLRGANKALSKKRRDRNGGWSAPFAKRSTWRIFSTPICYLAEGRYLLFTMESL